MSREQDNDDQEGFDAVLQTALNSGLLPPLFVVMVGKGGTMIYSHHWIGPGGTFHFKVLTAHGESRDLQPPVNTLIIDGVGSSIRAVQTADGKTHIVN